MGDLESIFNDEWPDHHRSGVVSIVGRPNVGKSTLVNQILGQKIAIVTDVPQTTRRQQLGIYTTDDVQILFTDTPGIHDPHHKLGEYMNRVARAALRDADAILWVVDASANPTKEDQAIAEMLTRTGKTPVVVALNKIDLIAEDRREMQFAPYHALLASDRVTFLPVSAAEGTYIDRLMDQLVELLPLGPRYYPKEQVSEVNLRYMAAEVVREKIILNTYEEIPHSVAVEIDIFEEKPNDTYEIHATIYVEKSSQKGIIIGSKGTMIKQIGTQARQELEAMFAHSVQLFLHVKVLKNWRSEDRLMRRFGYSLSSDDN